MYNFVVGEFGFFVILETGLDLSGFVLSMLVRKPDGTVKEWEAAINRDSNTRMQYKIRRGDLDQSGVYVVHAKAVMGGVERIGRAVAFKVHGLYDRSQ